MIKFQDKVILVNALVNGDYDEFDYLRQITKEFNLKTGFLTFIYWNPEKSNHVYCFSKDNKMQECFLYEYRPSDKQVKNLYLKYQVTEDDIPSTLIYRKSDIIGEVNDYLLLDPAKVLAKVYQKDE